jgi:hypothetical protein
MNSFAVKSVSLTRSTDVFALLKVLLWARPMCETLTIVLLASNSKALMIAFRHFSSNQSKSKIHLDFVKLTQASSQPPMDSQGLSRILTDSNYHDY